MKTKTYLGSGRGRGRGRGKPLAPLCTRCRRQAMRQGCALSTYAVGLDVHMYRAIFSTPDSESSSSHLQNPFSAGRIWSAAAPTSLPGAASSPPSGHSPSAPTYLPPRPVRLLPSHGKTRHPRPPAARPPAPAPPAPPAPPRR